LVSNLRWAGVPFTLRTGKALAHRRSAILVHFRAASLRPFRGRPPRRPTCCGSAWPRPPGASRQSQRPRRSLPPGAGRVRALPGTAGAAAYGRLLLAVLQGDPTLSIRGGEAEECWRITEPILAAWAADAAPL
jgi:glucose-6-phosphate 1-dehydrogenase